MNKIIIILFYFASIINIHAQTEDKNWNIGLHGGLIQYSGDLGKGFYHTDQSAYGFGGVSVSRFLTGNLDVNLLVTKGEIGYNGFVNDTARSFHQAINSATINFRFNLIGPKSFVRPYLFIGGGLLTFDKNYSVDDKKNAFAIPSFGGGVNIKMGPAVMLQVQEMFILSDNDTKDGYAKGGNDMFMLHTLGFTFNFGNKKDADKDGVSDRNDKCPNTPPDAKVDETGCPLDKDKDGVADYQDECPDIAGDVSLKGCPDKDKDGVTDTKDNCPDIAGEVTLKGCPDKDKDGITDKDDRCPELAGTAELKGCPDKDSDGVADIDDKCPDTKVGSKVDATGCELDNDKDGILNADDLCPDLFGILALKGCPDTDGDGVADNEDHCPTVKGTFANKGCPEMAKADVKKIIEIASKIYFEFDKADLKSISLPQLDALVDILKRYEAANLSIEGHTDNVGDDTYNMNLSQQRTESVKTYLMSKGILESRLTAVGFGEKRPIADNNTKAGQTQNRRVELKTSY